MLYLLIRPSWLLFSVKTSVLKPVYFAFSLCSEAGHLKDQPSLSSLDVSKKPPGSGVVSPSLTPLALPSKPESVVSITSQCSYSSTIVHVGDKKGKLISSVYLCMSVCLAFLSFSPVYLFLQIMFLLQNLVSCLDVCCRHVKLF